MNKSILWIVDGWRYWDATNGNSYHLTRVTHTTTGKSEIFEECEGNMRSFLSGCDRVMNIEPRIHTAPIQDIKYREWQRMLKCEYSKPVAQYQRRKHGGKLVNVTNQIINSLRSTKS